MSSKWQFDFKEMALSCGCTSRHLRKVWRNEDLISELGGDVVIADEEAEQIYKDMINIRGTMTDNRHLLEDMQLKIMVKMQMATSMRGADDLELFSWKQSKKGRRFLIK